MLAAARYDTGVAQQLREVSCGRQILPRPLRVGRPGRGLGSEQMNGRCSRKELAVVGCLVLGVSPLVTNSCGVSPNVLPTQAARGPRGIKRRDYAVSWVYCVPVIGLFFPLSTILLRLIYVAVHVPSVPGLVIQGRGALQLLLVDHGLVLSELQVRAGLK